MKILDIKCTKCTPEILFNPENGEFSINGDSYPENAYDFYKPAIDWLDKFIEEKDRKDLVLNIKIKYFDTTSSKCLLEIFEKLEKHLKKGNKVNINWLYNIKEEDYDSIESIEELFIGMDLPYKFIKE